MWEGTYFGKFAKQNGQLKSALIETQIRVHQLGPQVTARIARGDAVVHALSVGEENAEVVGIHARHAKF